MRFRQEELSNLEKAMKELQVSAENRKAQPEHERQLLERQKAVLRQGRQAYRHSYVPSSLKGQVYRK